MSKIIRCEEGLRFLIAANPANLGDAPLQTGLVGIIFGVS
jgi:hypothetical protein